MKRLLLLTLPLLTSLACALAVDTADTETANQPAQLTDARPAVVILSPQSDEQYALGIEVPIYIEARDLGSGVSQIVIQDNFDETIGTIMADNIQGDAILTGTVFWTPPTAQRHFIKAQALRADGTGSVIAETSIQVVVVEGFAPPPPVEPSPAESTEAPASDGDGATDTTNSAATEPAQPAAPAQGSDPVVEPTATTVDVQEPAPANENATGTLPAVVAIPLNVRVAPNVSAELATNPLQQGATLELIGRSEDNLWFAITLSTGGTGWIFGDGVTVDGDPMTLPLVAAP